MQLISYRKHVCSHKACSAASKEVTEKQAGRQVKVARGCSFLLSRRSEVREVPARRRCSSGSSAYPCGVRRGGSPVGEGLSDVVKRW